MLIKDPSRYKIRNANSHDCFMLFQLVKQFNFELNQLIDQSDKKDLIQKFNPSIDLNNNRLRINKMDLTSNLSSNNQSTLEQFEEFIDCLGFGKNGEKRKVLDCLLIEDLEERKIIALLTYSYGYFSYNGKEIHLNHFYVHPEYRLKNFGRLLFLNLAKFASEQNLHKIKYDAPRKNEGFCKFMSKAFGVRSFTDDTGYCLFKMDLKTIKTKLIDLF